MWEEISTEKVGKRLIVVRCYRQQEYEVSLYQGAVSDANLRQRVYCQTYKLALTTARRMKRAINTQDR